MNNDQYQKNPLTKQREKAQEERNKRPAWLWVEPDKKDHRKTWRDIPQRINKAGSLIFTARLMWNIIIFCIGVALGMHLIYRLG